MFAIFFHSYYKLIYFDSNFLFVFCWYLYVSFSGIFVKGDNSASLEMVPSVVTTTQWAQEFG